MPSVFFAEGFLILGGESPEWAFTGNLRAEASILNYPGVLSETKKSPEWTFTGTLASMNELS